MSEDEYVLIDNVRQEDEHIILTVDESIASLQAVERSTGERHAVPFTHRRGTIVLDLASLPDRLPNRMTRFDLFARRNNEGFTVTSGELRLRVVEFQSLPVWKRYFRVHETRIPMVPHIYINRGGSVSLVVRNPAFLDHGERQFRHRHELTALRIRRRSIDVEFTLSLIEVDRFHVTRCYLKYQSNETLAETDAIRPECRWQGQHLQGRFTIKFSDDTDLIPLRHALYIELQSESGQKVQVRLDHLSERLHTELNSRVLPPRIPLRRHRVLALATSPRTSLLSFLVRPATISDTQRVRQWCFVAIARAEALARRVLRKPRRMTALIFEKESATAQDNGIALFDALSRRREAISFDVRFLMDRTSSQWDRVAGRQGVIAKFSLAHWRTIVSPRTFLAASETRYHAAHLYAQPSLLDRHVYARKHYFLQHGVTGFTRVTIFDPDLAIFPDYAVATAAWERDVLVERGMSAENIDITGFARWDRLQPSIARPATRILYMPTGREWLEGRATDELLNTEYTRRISSFLRSDRLANMLEQHNARLSFLPHPKFTELTAALSEASPRVDFLDQASVQFTDLINESDVVITDYSSIAWEFIRGAKNVLLYRFDHEAYSARLNHAMNSRLKSLVSKIETAQDEDGVLDALHGVLTRAPEQRYEMNCALRNEAFDVVDAHNSRRITDAIARRLCELREPRHLPDYPTADQAYKRYLRDTLAIRDA